MNEERPSLWAKIDSNNVVIETTCATRQWILSGKSGNPDDWIEYTNGKGDGLPGPCGIGATYSHDLNQFIIPAPYPSWVLNTQTLEWEAPIEKPQEVFVVLGGPIGIQTSYKVYEWNEETLSWVTNVEGILPTGDSDEESSNYIAPTRTQAEAEADGG